MGHSRPVAPGMGHMGGHMVRERELVVQPRGRGELETKHYKKSGRCHNAEQ